MTLRKWLGGNTKFKSLPQQTWSRVLSRLIQFVFDDIVYGIQHGLFGRARILSQKTACFCVVPVILQTDHRVQDFRGRIEFRHQGDQEIRDNCRADFILRESFLHNLCHLRMVISSDSAIKRCPFAASGSMASTWRWRDRVRRRCCSHQSRTSRRSSGSDLFYLDSWRPPRKS